MFHCGGNNRKKNTHTSLSNAPSRTDALNKLHPSLDRAPLSHSCLASRQLSRRRHNVETATTKQSLKLNPKMQKSTGRKMKMTTVARNATTAADDDESVPAASVDVDASSTGNSSITLSTMRSPGLCDPNNNQLLHEESSSSTTTHRSRRSLNATVRRRPLRSRSATPARHILIQHQLLRLHTHTGSRTAPLLGR